MEAVLQTNTQTVLDHHLSSFLEANLDEILKDYTHESEVLTPDGPIRGLHAIGSFYGEVFKMIPKGSHLELKQMIIRDEVAFLSWSCDSPHVSIPLGTDTFIVEGNKIHIQTLAAHIISK